MKKNTILIILTITFLISNCSTTRTLEVENPKKIKSIPCLSYQLMINDKRQNIDNRELKIPLITFGNEYDRITPPLKNNEDVVLNKIIDE